MKKGTFLQHLMVLAVMLLASGSNVYAQMSEAMQAAMQTDMSTWNFTTTKRVEVDGVSFRFKLDEAQGLAQWLYFDSYDVAPETLTIPASFTYEEKEYFVVSTGGYAAYTQRNTTEINLPITMRYLDAYTFYPYENVKVITLPENVEKLGANVFYGWDNKVIHFTRTTPPEMQANSLTDYPNNHHMKVYVPSDGFRQYAKVIEGQCVVAENWQEVNAFSAVHTGQCDDGELGYIVVADILPDVRTYAEINKLVIDKGTINETDWYSLRQMPNLIYLDLSGLSIEEIPAGALNGCWQLETIVFPESLKYIRGNALRDTGVGELNFPESLSEITGGDNFRNCDSLTSVVIPDGVTSLPGNCFRACDNLHQVQLPHFLTDIGSECFRQCDLYGITIPGTLTGISSYCFYDNCNMTSVTFEEGVTAYVGYDAFASCERLGESSAVVLPSSMRTINQDAFSGCTTMFSIILNEGLETIENDAFYNCKGLTRIVLPSSLIYCLDHPFYGCDNIVEITCKSLLPPTVRNNVITYTARNIKLKVPLWSFQEYMTTPGWLEFQANLVIDSDIRPENVYINKEFEFVLGEDQNLKDYEPNIRLFYNSDEIDDGFGHTKYERGNLTISSRSKLKINDFSMHFSPYAKYHADRSRFYSGVNYDTYRTQYNPNSLIVRGELRAENQTINLMVYNDRWQFISFPFDVIMSDIVPEDNLTQWVVRYYDGAERAAQHFDNTWKNLTSSDILEAGKGYIMKCYLNNPQNNLVRFTVTPVTESLNHQSLFNSNDFTTELADYPTENQLLTSDRSWNLIGNPYPCYYDTRYMDTEAPFLVWDSYYLKYVAFSPVDDDYILTPGEAFFIQRPTAGDGKLVFREGGRQTYRNPNDLTVSEAREFAFGTSSSRTVLNIILTGEETSDRTRIVFNDKAEMGYEVSRDAALFAAMSSEASQIWTANGSVRYAINERPLGDGIVELGVTCGKTGTYTIALGANSGVESVMLQDRLTGKTVAISTEQGYTFQSSAGSIAGRFFISGSQADAIESLSPTLSEGDGAVYDLSGRRVNADEKGIVIKNGIKMLNK